MNVNDFKQINPFARVVSRQTNTRHLSWMTQFRNRVQSEITEVVGQDVPTMLASAIAQLNAAVEHEDETYMLPSFKAQSEQLMQLDKERDRKYKAAKLMAKAMTSIGSAEQQQCALELLAEMDHYDVDVRVNYVEETTSMNELIQELQTEAWQTRLAVLELKTAFDGLASINGQMQQLIDERNDGQSQIPLQALRTARAASDEAYAVCVMMVNVFSVSEQRQGVSPYDEFIDHVNQDQEYYVEQVFTMEKKPGV